MCGNKFEQTILRFSENQITWILDDNLIFLHKSISCGYSLELSFRGDSNEYPRPCFYEELKKIIL